MKVTCKNCTNFVFREGQRWCSEHNEARLPGDFCSLFDPVVVRHHFHVLNPAECEAAFQKLMNDPEKMQEIRQWLEETKNDKRLEGK